MIDVRRCWKHRFVFIAVLLTHHSIGLFDNHASVFNGLVAVRRERVWSVGWATGWGNGAGVNVGIDDRLIMLLLMMMLWLMMITWKKVSILVFWKVFHARESHKFKKKRIIKLKARDMLVDLSFVCAEIHYKTILIVCVWWFDHFNLLWLEITQISFILSTLIHGSMKKNSRNFDDITW